MTGGIPKLWTAEVVSRMLTLVGTMYMARTLGVAAYGLVGYVAAATMYLTTFVRFGSDYIIVRELSQQRSDSEAEQAALRSSSVILRTLLTVPALFFLFLMAVSAEGAILRRLYIASALGLVAVIVPLDPFLQSKRNFTQMAVSRILFNVLNLAIVIFWATAPDRAWVVPAASGAAMIITQAFFVSRLKGIFALPSMESFRGSAVLLVKESFPLLASMTLLLLIGQFGVVAVRSHSTGEELGVYVAAFKMTDLANTFVGQIAVVFFPALVTAWKSDDAVKRNEHIAKGITISLPLTLLMFGLVVICGGELFSLILGGRFFESGACAIPLAGVLVFRSVSMFYANGLVAGGRQKTLTAVVLASAIMNVALTFVLIPYIGYRGAAWANLGAFAAEHCLLLYAVRRSLSFRRLVRVCVPIVSAFAATLVAAIGLKTLLPDAYAAGRLPYLALGVVFVGAFATLMHKQFGKSLRIMFS